MSEATWIVLLRGINVGGTGKLPMASLRTLLAALGHKNVQTYIQSGNCVIQDSVSDAGDLERQIESAIEEQHGFRPVVMVISLAELRAAFEATPFDVPANEANTVHLFFLSQSATCPELSELERIKKPDEAFHLSEKVFYLHAPGGIGRSKLAMRAEHLVGVPTTARNLKTVQALLEMAE